VRMTSCVLKTAMEEPNKCFLLDCFRIFSMYDNNGFANERNGGRLPKPLRFKSLNFCQN